MYDRAYGDLLNKVIEIWCSGQGLPFDLIFLIILVISAQVGIEVSKLCSGSLNLGIHDGITKSLLGLRLLKADLK